MFERMFESASLLLVNPTHMSASLLPGKPIAGMSLPGQRLIKLNLIA